MGNLFQYTKTEGQGWLVGEKDKFKYDYPDPGKEMELGKDFEVMINHFDQKEWRAIPITQRTYSERDLFDAWDAGLKNGWDNARHGHATPSKQNYLKQKFGIEIK